MNAVEIEKLAAAIDRAASEFIPGAVLKKRPAVEFREIVLPVPGLGVRFSVRGVPKMRVRRGLDREGLWANVPVVTDNLMASAKRIASEVSRLVREECWRVAYDRRQDPDRFRTQHVGAFMAPAELEEIRELATRRGLSVSGLMRRGFELAKAEPRLDGIETDEANLRAVLRLVVSSDRWRYPTTFGEIAEAGSERDVVLALRSAFRLMPEGRAAARALDLEWLMVEADVAHTHS